MLKLLKCKFFMTPVGLNILRVLFAISILSWVKVQFRGLDLPTNQVAANDKVSPSALFKSANGEIASICIILKIYQCKIIGSGRFFFSVACRSQRCVMIYS